MSIKKKALSCAYAILCTASLIAIAVPQRASAQSDDPPGRVARLSFLRGAVSFQPAGENDWVTATLNRPMTTGDKLWADMDSRAELHIGSAAIRLESNTGFSFLNLDDRTVQIQLSAGTLGIHVRRLERDEVFEVDTPNQAFSILRPGVYRVEASEDGTRTMVMVESGKGEATGGDRTYTIESHERASLTGTDVLSADIDELRGRDRDDFDDWCAERDHREEHSQSVRYVSPDMVGYEDLDEYGGWRHDPEYGWVWVPTVAAGWAPYHYGHWAWIAPWGWTWVDDDPWGYAPFHYGRWAYGRGAWFWVPGPVSERPVYAPALVAFVGGPNFSVAIGVGGGGAIGWFPLGPREVYVPAYRVSPDYVTRVNVSNTNVNRVTVTNVYNTTLVNNTTVVNNVTYVNRAAPGGVTAVSTTAFTSAQPVANSAVRVNPNQVASATVVTRASVVPTQNSVLGPDQRGPRREVPPARFAERPVVAKTPPPPPPVPFERQQAALAAHPGQPLAHTEVENLRPVNLQHPLVKQPTPGHFDEPNHGERQVTANPGSPNRQPTNSPNLPGGAVNRPGNNPSVAAPVRNEPPESRERGNRPAVDERTNAEPTYRPSSVQPAESRPDYRVGQGGRSEEPARTNAEPTNDRPAKAQPSYRPPSANSRPNPGADVNERPSINNAPRNEPAPEPANNRSANQPSYRPPSANNPSSAAPPSERRSPNDEPVNRPTNTQSNERPSPRPSANSQPQNTPAPANNRAASPAPQQNRNSAPSQQPAARVQAVPENNSHSAQPASARSNGNSSGNNKEKQK